jgi:hypothetical protein
MPTNCNILDQHYWALGPDGALINLSGKVADPKTDGFGLKMKKQGVESGRHVYLLDGGIGGGEYTFYVYFKTDTERQTFQNSINNDAEDYRLHIGRSDRFYFVKKISTEPEKVKGAAGPVQKVTCWMEDPGIYHTVDQGIDLGACSLPQDGTNKYNYGSSLAPFLFKIGGQYNSGLQLTLPFLQVIEGSTVETSLALGPGLLSNEYAELTLCGWHEYYLTHTYADLYSNNNYWQYDTVQSLCSLAGGQVSVPAGGWFYYKFQGYPTKENIRLIATITKTGSPIIQYSMDGSTWYTSITAAEIISGVQTIYDLTGTEKRSTIYIRFYSPAGSSMTVQDVAFSMERDISSQYAQMPSCPAGETRKIRVTGSGSTKAKISTTFRSRWHAQ